MAAGRSRRSIPTPAAARTLRARSADQRARGVVRGVTYERSRDARVEESAAGRLHDGLQGAASGAVHEGRGCAERSGPGRQSGSGTTRRGTCPSRDRRRPRKRGSRSRAHDRERRVVARHRGREPAVPSAGEDLRRRLLDRAGRVRAGEPRPLVPSDAAHDRRVGRIVFEDETFTAKMRRSFTELVEWLLIDNPVPPGSVLLDGTGLVPPDDFTLLPDTSSRSTSPRSARSSNPVVRASELIEKEPVHDRDADRSARPQLRRRRVARERVRRDVREAKPMAAVAR